MTPVREAPSRPPSPLTLPRPMPMQRQIAFGELPTLLDPRPDIPAVTMAVARRFLVFNYSFGPHVYDLVETLNRLLYLHSNYQMDSRTWGEIGVVMDHFRFDVDPDRNQLIKWTNGQGYSEADQWFLDHGVEVHPSEMFEDPDEMLRMADWGDDSLGDLESVNFDSDDEEHDFPQVTQTE